MSSEEENCVRAAFAALYLIVDGTPLPRVVPPIAEAISSLLVESGLTLAVCSNEGEYTMVDAGRLAAGRGRDSIVGRVKESAKAMHGRCGRSIASPLRLKRTALDPSSADELTSDGGLPELIPCVAVLNARSQRLVLLLAHDWSKQLKVIQLASAFPHSACALADQQSVAVSCVHKHMIFIYDINTGHVIRELFGPKSAFAKNWVTSMWLYGDKLLASDLRFNCFYAFDAPKGPHRTSTVRRYANNWGKAVMTFTAIFVMDDELFLWDDYSSTGSKSCAVLGVEFLDDDINNNPPTAVSSCRVQKPPKLKREFSINCTGQGGGAIPVPSLHCIAFYNKVAGRVQLLDKGTGHVIHEVCDESFAGNGILRLPRPPQNMSPEAEEE